MDTMKRILLLTMIAGFFATSASSQTISTTPTEVRQDVKQSSPTDWEKRITTDLKLTPDQITKWEILNKEYKVKIDEVMKASDLTKEAQKAKKMELKKEKEEQFMQLLTPEQQSRYKLIIELKKKEREAEKSKESGS